MLRQHPTAMRFMIPRMSVFKLPGVVLLSVALGAALPTAAQPRHDQNNFYQGASRGVHGGNYGNDRGRHYRNDNQNQGGIGPGKGSLIAGAAGAGIGAIIGGVAQNNRDNNNYYRH